MTSNIDKDSQPKNDLCDMFYSLILHVKLWLKRQWWCFL